MRPTYNGYGAPTPPSVITPATSAGIIVTRQQAQEAEGEPGLAEWKFWRGVGLRTVEGVVAGVALVAATYYFEKWLRSRK